MKQQGFVWLNDPERVIHTLRDEFSKLKGEVAVLWWPESDIGLRVPCRQVAWLTKVQCMNLGLREGDLVSVSQAPTGDWEVVEVHGIPVELWRAPDGQIIGRKEWGRTPNRLREFVMMDPPATVAEALLLTTMPLIVGSSNVVAGTPGSEKSKWIKRWVSKIWGPKIIIKTERSNEMVRRNAYGPDHLTEVWDIGGAERPSDVLIFVEFALLTIVRRAPYLPGNLTVLMDSVTAYTQALDFGLESTGKTKSGGLPTEVLEELWPLSVGLARHDANGSAAVTLLLVHAVSDKDSMAEGILNFLKSKLDSKVVLREGYSIPFIPLVLNRDLGTYGTLFRKVEDVVGDQAASWLFALFNTENHGQPFSEAATKVRLSRSQWSRYAELARKIWNKAWNPQRYPNRMGEILAEIWANWPTAVEYDGPIDIFPEEIRSDAEALLGRRQPVEVKRNPNGQPKADIRVEIPAPVVRQPAPTPVQVPAVVFTAADAAKADEDAKRLALQWAAQPDGESEADKALQFFGGAK